MERFRELVGFITDLTAEDGRYMEACLEERKIDHKRFKERMMKYLEKKKTGRGGRGAVWSKM